MLKVEHAKQVSRIALILWVMAMLSACGQTSDWIKGRISSSSEDPEILGAPEIGVYVQELGQIAGGDPAAQAEIFADAQAAASLTPSPSTNLRLGLVLAIPGHPESNPAEAQRLLREVLTQTVLLTPAEISLATIQSQQRWKSKWCCLARPKCVARVHPASRAAADARKQALNQRLASCRGGESPFTTVSLTEAEAKARRHNFD